jgi:hypothetical protein
MQDESRARIRPARWQEADVNVGEPEVGVGGRDFKEILFNYQLARPYRRGH